MYSKSVKIEKEIMNETLRIFFSIQHIPGGFPLVKVSPCRHSVKYVDCIPNKTVRSLPIKRDYWM